MNMKPPTTVKELQKLTNCIAALGTFMSKSANECLSFFKILKKKACFGWDKGAKQAFQSLKEYLERLPSVIW